MGCGRVLLCIIFPPLAVIDKGCGSVVIVTLLTISGWVPGVIGALVINNKQEGEEVFESKREKAVIRHPEDFE